LQIMTGAKPHKAPEMQDSAQVHPFPDHAHDHASCVAEALATADRICGQRGVRLTALRRRVLELVWHSHRPVGAYDLLGELARGGRRAAPPTVYRALQFLLDQGLVHRIESRNAFIGCAHPEDRHVVEIMLCLQCGRAAELPDDRIASAVRNAAKRLGFEVQRQTIEVTGLCAACQAEPSRAAAGG
jgi:Fur family zinc uptake transcriptional regulator